MDSATDSIPVSIELSNTHNSSDGVSLGQSERILTQVPTNLYRDGSIGTETTMKGAFSEYLRMQLKARSDRTKQLKPHLVELLHANEVVSTELDEESKKTVRNEIMIDVTNQMLQRVESELLTVVEQLKLNRTSGDSLLNLLKQETNGRFEEGVPVRDIKKFRASYGTVAGTDRAGRIYQSKWDHVVNNLLKNPNVTENDFLSFYQPEEVDEYHDYRGIPSDYSSVDTSALSSDWHFVRDNAGRPYYKYNPSSKPSVSGTSSIAS